jgi:hypothetical protein
MPESLFMPTSSGPPVDPDVAEASPYMSKGELVCWRCKGSEAHLCQFHLFLPYY